MPDRRASHPSTPSSAVARQAIPTTVAAASGVPGAPIRLATTETRAARTVVTWFAGPNRGKGWK